MPLNASAAFTVGYLEGCIDLGLSPGEILGSVKRANDLLAGFQKQAFLGDLAGKAVDTAKGLGSAGFWTGLMVPPLVGGAAGYGLARASDIDDTDVETVKNKETHDEYRRQTLRLLRQKAIRDYQSLRRAQPGRMFL